VIDLRLTAVEHNLLTTLMLLCVTLLANDVAAGSWLLNLRWTNNLKGHRLVVPCLKKVHFNLRFCTLLLI
jgi:hypothetical protein